MKKKHVPVTSLAAFCLFLSVTHFSCKKDLVHEVPASPGIAVPKALTAFVAQSTGVSVDKVSFSSKDSTFIVDGDGLIDYSDALTRYNDHLSLGENDSQASEEQRKHSYSVSRALASSITIYVDPSVPALWHPILDKSIQNWNNAGSLIRLTRISTNTAHIKVTANYSVSSMIASANYPSSNGYPGRGITINTYKNSLEEAKKIFAITHEIGHTLGFTHTDGTYGNLINGTPLKDPNSIMNSICLYWNAFTGYDLLAFKTVYPR